MEICSSWFLRLCKDLVKVRASAHKFYWLHSFIFLFLFLVRVNPYFSIPRFQHLLENPQTFPSHPGVSIQWDVPDTALLRVEFNLVLLIWRSSSSTPMISRIFAFLTLSRTVNPANIRWNFLPNSRVLYLILSVTTYSLGSWTRRRM